MVLEEEKVNPKNVYAGLVEVSEGILIIFFPGHLDTSYNHFKKKVGVC